jgi:UDP-N-acetylglucosamine 4,6-dehydratase/5-epimerase
MLNGKKVLITGGTGSFGRAFVSKVFEVWPDISRLVIFSRDELKQSEILEAYVGEKFAALRCFLGDIRDQARLERALNGIEIVIHAAALKQVPAAEYNPMEFIKTNIMGSANLVEACVNSGVAKVIALSTDKAAAPINLYGATKLCSDKLFVAANSYAGNFTKFSVVRYGNVFGSRGSVVPFFLGKVDSGTLPITDPSMTRFNITLEEGVDLVFFAIENAIGGEILVPKIPSYRVVDVASAIGPNCEQITVGIRPGEKVHEEMITKSDSHNTLSFGNKFVITPSVTSNVYHYYKEKFKASAVREGSSYNSESNDRFLNIEEIRELVSVHLSSRPKST